MPSVLEQKFKITFTIPSKHEREVQRYLEQNVGGRTYYLHTRMGGKHWAIQKNPFSGKIDISVDDEALASFITLKFL